MTCKECIHYEACHDMYYEEHATRHFDPEKHDAEKECGYFKDRSRFVELPCHTGEKVWVTYLGRKETRSAEKGEVIGFYITASLYVYTSVILEDGSTFTGTYGENVFPRKENLEERENNARRNDT